MSERWQGHFSAYKNALTTLSIRTGAPLPSLILSFGILHEVTAVVPLVAVFYGARTLGIGEGVIGAITPNTPATAGIKTSWPKETLQTWVAEGNAWASKVGRRYGIFGFDKKVPGSNDDIGEYSKVPSHIAGDVANAIVAYGATKALLPVRVGISLYLSPAFSRRIVEPVRKILIQPFRRSK